MRFLNTILDIIFPVNCISCKSRGALLCSDCLANCPEAERESEKWIFPMYDYRHPSIKKSIWLLKYKNKRSLAKIFAEVLYPRILEELSDMIAIENFKNPALIPIPLSKKRLRERGFNQALLLCEEIIGLDKNENLKILKGILVKPEETEHQAKIKDRRKRIENIVGSFKIENNEEIAGKNIILIDDVTTTGATLKEAKRVLKSAGARKIIAFTLAH